MSRSAIVVHEYGDRQGPLMVLLHGLTEAGTAWPDAVDRWSKAWHILAPDQRGHGRSDRFDADGLAEPLETWVGDLATLLSGLDVPAVVVGHSLGGRVAAITALRSPELFRGLLLEDPALTEGTVTPPGCAEANLEFLATFDHELEAEKRRMRAETSWTPAEIDAWAGCKPMVDRTLFSHLELGDFHASAVLSRLEVPTLVIWDGDGPLAIDPSLVVNPLVRCEYVPDVGHCIRRDDPAVFHAIADPWLASLR